MAIGSQQAKTAEAEVNGWVGAPSTPITLAEHDVRKDFKHVNTKKAADQMVSVGESSKYVLTN